MCPLAAQIIAENLRRFESRVIREKSPHDTPMQAQRQGK